MVLQPDTFYLYEVTLRSEGPLMPLYWRYDDQEHYLQYGLFPEWTRFRVLFHTPDREGTPHEAVLSPVLFDHYDVVEMKGLRLVEVRPFSE